MYLHSLSSCSKEKKMGSWGWWERGKGDKSDVIQFQPEALPPWSKRSSSRTSKESNTEYTPRVDFMLVTAQCTVTDICVHSHLPRCLCTRRCLLWCIILLKSYSFPFAYLCICSMTNVCALAYSYMCMTLELIKCHSFMGFLNCPSWICS